MFNGVPAVVFKCDSPGFGVAVGLVVGDHVRVVYVGSDGDVAVFIDWRKEATGRPAVGAVGWFATPSSDVVGAAKAREFASGGCGPGFVNPEAIAEVEFGGFFFEVFGEVDGVGAAVEIIFVDIGL